MLLFYLFSIEPLSISPPYGHIFGGVAVLVSGPTFKEDDILNCIFGGIEVEATYISAGYASCVSPRLRTSIGVTFNIKINNAIYEYSAAYYPRKSYRSDTVIRLACTQELIHLIFSIRAI